MCSVKIWQQTSHIGVVEAILGMSYLKSVDVLHPEYLSAENLFVSV